MTEVIKMSKESFDKMMERLDNPQPPSEKLIEATREYHRMIEEGELKVVEEK